MLVDVESQESRNGRSSKANDTSFLPRMDNLPRRAREAGSGSSTPPSARCPLSSACCPPLPLAQLPSDINTDTVKLSAWQRIRYSILMSERRTKAVRVKTGCQVRFPFRNKAEQLLILADRIARNDM